MIILGKKAIGPMTNSFGSKAKAGSNTFGNKLVKVVANTMLNHAVDKAIKHYSPLEKR